MVTRLLLVLLPGNEEKHKLLLKEIIFLFPLFYTLTTTALIHGGLGMGGFRRIERK